MIQWQRQTFRRRTLREVRARRCSALQWGSLSASARSAVAALPPFSVGIGQVSYWFPRDQQGRALAFYAGLGNSSPGLVALLLPLIIAAGGLWVGGLGALGGFVVPPLLGRIAQAMRLSAMCAGTRFMWLWLL